MRESGLPALVKRYKRAFVAAMLLAMLCAVAAFAGINARIMLAARPHIIAPDEARAYVCIVPGARVYPDGRLSHIYYDRLMTAAELYRAGRVRRILVSADHRRTHYDESNAGKNFLLRQGIPARDIFTDHAGFDTYDTMIRAKRVFMVNDAVVATQRYHLYRSVYLGRALGMQVRGVIADRRGYQRMRYYRFRELFANIKAFRDIVLHADPRFYGAPIPITGDSSASDG
jgi:SanA protein